MAMTDVLLEENRKDKELALALLDYKNTAAAAEPAIEAFELTEEPEESVGLCLTKKEASKLWTVKLLDDGTWRVSAYKGADTFLRNNRKAVLRIHRGNTKVMEYLSDSKRKVEFL